MTFAPASTKVLAAASQIPRLAPVIKTVLPLKFNIFVDLYKKNQKISK